MKTRDDVQARIDDSPRDSVLHAKWHSVYRRRAAVAADQASLVDVKVDAALRAYFDHFVWIKRNTQKAFFHIVKNVFVFVQRFERDATGVDPPRTEAA